MCPDIQNYHSLSHYLFDYFEFLKSNDETISYRKVAKHLEWSISYFNEVIHGKRHLSINKGVELIKYLNLSELDAEKFLVLLLENSESEQTKDYFNKVLVKNYQNKNVVEVYPELTSDKNISAVFFSDFSLVILFAFLRWRNSSFKKSDLNELLYSYPSFSDDIFLENKLTQLDQLNIIKLHRFGEEVEYEILKENIVTSYTRETIHQFQHYFQNQISIVKSPEMKGSIHAGFIKIHKKKYMELLSRMAMLKNWALQTEMETKDSNFQDQILIQYDFSALLALNIEKTGVKDFKQWLSE